MAYINVGQGWSLTKQNKNAGGNNVCQPGPGPKNVDSSNANCNCRGPSGQCPCRKGGC